MVLGISYILEIVAMIGCLYWLYKTKISISIPIIGTVAGYMILFGAINYWHMNHLWSLLVYGLLGVFCKIQFHAKWRSIIGHLVAAIFLIGISQIFGALVGSILHVGTDDPALFGLLTNGITFLIIFLLYKTIDLEKILPNIKIKGVFVKQFLMIITAGGLAYVVYAKIFRRVDTTEALIYFSFSIIIVIFTYIWGKYKSEALERQLELKLYQEYSNTYDELILSIRARQHEYDNHLQTILNQKYVYNTYEDLVAAQTNYIQKIVGSDKYSKLLRSGNKTFIAFLYGRLLQMEEKDIECQYAIQIEQLTAPMPVYKMIEICNNLLLNAQEALLTSDEVVKIVKIFAHEDDKSIMFEVWNNGKPISFDAMGKFFKKGVSSKGKMRGLGLYNVKRTCDEYHADVLFDNKYLENRNWITFSIKIPKSVYK